MNKLCAVRQLDSPCLFFRPSLNINLFTARWFARLLLEGVVLPELRSVLRKDRMKDAPALLTQMKPNPKVSEASYEQLKANNDSFGEQYLFRLRCHIFLDSIVLHYTVL